MESRKKLIKELPKAELHMHIEGIWSALQEGERQLGISSCVIMCFLRHLDQADAFSTLDSARLAMISKATVSAP